VARRWEWVTDNETGVKVLLLLLMYLWYASAGQECNLEQCMCGIRTCIGHDAPQILNIPWVAQCGKQMDMGDR
jgi:hypothetical protein